MAVVGGRGPIESGRTGGDVTGVRNNEDVSRREDLANFISMITRDETPFMSSISKGKATAIYHEWQTDTLTPPGNSRIEEGTDYITPGITLAGTDVSPFQNPDQGSANIGAQFNEVGNHRSRLGNYCQINGKTVAVSGTRRAIDQVGVADEYAYQLKKRGTEMRRDIEHDLIHKYQTQSNTGQRRMGGFQSYVNATNGVSHLANHNGTVIANGAVFRDQNGALDTGVVADASEFCSGRFALSPVNADKVSLSLSDIDQVMQNIYEEGGKATKIMLSPKLRRDFSDLMVTDSGVRRNIDMDGKLRQSVDIYMSDFGDLMVVPNYIMGLSHTIPAGGTGATEYVAAEAANSMALVYDPQWFSMITLRPLQEVDVAQRGDSTIGMMVEELSFEVKNPLGCGAIYNLQ